MLNRSQAHIISKINLFFQLDHRQQNFERGYCHGLTLLWLYKMKHQEEEWFYRTIANICNATTLLHFKKFEKDLEEFIYHIEWLQNSSKYEDGMTQAHIEELEKASLLDNLSYLFTPEQIKLTLAEAFAVTDRVAISSTNHSMGIYKRNDIYMLYDPNYSSGQHKQFHSLYTLKGEILRRFFQINALLLKKFPLIFNIFQVNNEHQENPDNLTALHKKIIASKKIPDEIGFEGNTDLMMASESGNANEVKLLIENGANPNQKDSSLCSPLFIATANNHIDVVNQLLKLGADPNMRSFNDYTPLMCAAAFGFEVIMHTLLTNNGNPLVESEDKKTALSTTLLRKHWRVALILISYVSSIHLLNSYDLELVTFCLPHLKKEVNSHPEDFSSQQKAHFEKMLGELEEKKPKISMSL